MKRRAFLQAAAGAALAADRPNILLILTDQQSADAMSCRMGDRYLRTPNMDSLARSGRLFTRAYCANPLCIPSRTSLFTGRYPPQTGIQTNERAELDVQRFPVLGSIFQRAGYKTAYFGKWHLPVPEARTDLHGFEVRVRGQRDVATAANAVEFLRTPGNAPFLLVASFLNPHNICEWPRGEKLTEGEVGTPPPLDQLPPRRPNHGTPKNETDIMLLMRRAYQSSRQFPVGDYDEKKWREYLWAYYRMIEIVDGRIGEVLRALRDARLAERTLIVLTADHGDCQGAHGWSQKTVFYDESARVPYVTSWPGVIPPGVSDEWVHTGVDLLPRLCRHAGVPAPPGLPAAGRDYLVVCNKMVQGLPVDGRQLRPEGRMVRSRRYKYCMYNEGERRESLVDMDDDPGEMVNVVAEPRYRQVLAQHRRWLAEWTERL
jgi:arylsulfatase A-like enzyme